MCIYIHPCLILSQQKEVTGVVHIGVGFLRCSFPVIWHCEGLEMRSERRGEISHALFIYSRQSHSNPSAQGNQGGHTATEQA